MLHGGLNAIGSGSAREHELARACHDGRLRGDAGLGCQDVAVLLNGGMPVHLEAIEYLVVRGGVVRKQAIDDGLKLFVVLTLSRLGLLLSDRLHGRRALFFLAHSCSHWFCT